MSHWEASSTSALKTWDPGLDMALGFGERGPWWSRFAPLLLWSAACLTIGASAWSLSRAAVLPVRLPTAAQSRPTRVERWHYPHISSTSGGGSTGPPHRTNTPPVVQLVPSPWSINHTMATVSILASSLVALGMLLWGVLSRSWPRWRTAGHAHPPLIHTDAPMVMAGVTGKDPETADLIFDRFDTDYISDYDGEYDDVEEGAPPAEGTAAEVPPDLALLKSLEEGGREKLPGYERAFLVGVEQQYKGDQRVQRLRQQQEDLMESWEKEEIEWGVEESLRELAELARTAGMEVVGFGYQRKALPDPKTFLGSGKLQEVALECYEKDVEFLIFDEELSPSQMRNVDKVLEKVRQTYMEANPRKEVMPLRVMDRTNLILDIFAQHARTREGILQVALAEQQYQLPRLKRMWSHLERQQGFGGGAMGRGGMGETQKEVDRRLIKQSILRLKQELEKVQLRRAQLRAGRKRVPYPTVTIVGYTNAGKSTLLNHLTDAGVIAEDMLFATLDPTTRKVALPGGLEILLTDTVGFIQKLPTTLVAAFKSTLEELQEASLIVNLVDISSTGARAQMHAVENVLAQVGAQNVPVLNVWNKMDALPPTRQQQLQLRAQFTQNTVLISAQDGTGVPELLTTMESLLQSDLQRVEVLLPWAQGSLLNEMHERGSEIQETFAASGEGTHVRGLVPLKVANKLNPYMCPFPGR